MRIAVIADIHNRISNLARVLEKLALLKPEALVCCGDLGSEETLDALAGLGIPIHFCMGNCDAGRLDELRDFSRLHPLLNFTPAIGTLELPDGGRLGFTHQPSAARQMAISGKYKAVFYGHTHKAASESVDTPAGPCLLANPGDVQGRYGNPSGMVWDSEGGEILSI